MNETDPAEAVTQIKRALNVLCNLVLLKELPGDFDDIDLVNVLAVLTYVAHSLAWKNPEFEHLTIEQRCIVATEVGQNLRQTLTLFTGIDPAEVVTKSPSYFDWPETLEEKTK